MKTENSAKVILSGNFLIPNAYITEENSQANDFISTISN